MIDYMSIRQSIEEHLGDNFTLCAVKYENIPLTPTDAKSFISVFDRQTFSESAEMGSGVYHSGGMLIIQIFTQLNIGTNEGRIIAQTLSDLFNSSDIGGLLFDTPELQPSEPNEHWYQMNLVIPYTTVMGQDASSC